MTVTSLIIRLPYDLVWADLMTFHSFIKAESVAHVQCVLAALRKPSIVSFDQLLPHYIFVESFSCRCYTLLYTPIKGMLRYMRIYVFLVLYFLFFCF